MLSMGFLRNIVGRMFCGILGIEQRVFTRRYYFYQEHDGERTLLSKKALLTLLSTNEDMKNYISKDERYKQYISPDNIVMSENGEFFAGLINMDYIKKIVNYLNSRVESNK